MNYDIFPRAKKQEEKEIVFKASNFTVFFPKKMINVAKEMQTFLLFKEGNKENSNIVYLVDKTLKEEAYDIDIDQRINIKANSLSGFYYATKTLKQIFMQTDYKEGIEGVHIYDEPDIKVRGFMFDISRGKVAKLDTLKYIVDVMSELKMNHFELYVEGFSFEYKSFEQYLEKNCYITISEYKKLEKYCNEHCIDFVPNENGFGHMTEWLKKDEFKDLAEMPGGIHIWGTDRLPSTLNPLDHRSVELVSKMYDDMLTISKSKYFHMNLDEPFELGMGKSKEECDKKGIDEVYIEYTNKLVDVVKKYNKEPLIWGDVLARHKADLTNMPKDIIYVDWGYDGGYRFDKNLRLLKEKGVKFMAAPGTTNWCGWLGRLYDWIDNISNAVWSVKKLDGEGILLTEWGDFGHPQLFPPLFPPLAYAGMLSYRCKTGTVKEVRDFLNKFVYKDKHGLFADVVMDSSSYYQYEEEYRGNGTIAFAVWYKILASLQREDKFARLDVLMKNCHINEFKAQALIEFLNSKKKLVKLCDVDDLWKNELIHTLDLVKAWTEVNVGLNDKVENYKRINYLVIGIKDLEKSKKGIKKVWLARNKRSHLDDTIANYDIAIAFLNEYLERLQGGSDEA